MNKIKIVFFIAVLVFGVTPVFADQSDKGQCPQKRTTKNAPTKFLKLTNPLELTEKRLKKGEIARNISRSMMETYRHLYICPPFMKNFPILICDQIITSAKNVDKFAYFELTLGEYIQVNIFNIINNKALNIVTNKMLLDQDKVINNQTSNVVNDVCSSVDSSSHSRLFLLLNISFVFEFVFMTCESK